jgi:hypothetical protein
MAQQQLTAQQRAALFATATRQTFQTLPTQQVTGEGQTVQFTLPKVRLLSKIYLEVNAKATLKSSKTNLNKDKFSPYGILRRVSLDLNNGFSPFVVSGRDIFLYNMNRLNPNIIDGTYFGMDTSKGMVNVQTNASANGTDANINLVFELPVTLNDRDPVGLIMLQSEETSVTLTVDVDKLANAYKLDDGDEVIFKSLSLTPMLETFSIPPIKEAFPDISVLKLVDSKTDTFAGNGQNIVKLNTGTIYRKLILYFEDSNGNPLKDSDFSGNLELVFNQADIPVSIKPSILSARNASQLGFYIPDGVYIFDFSNQGIPNLGGTRDYIDTERLTEFWVRFSTQKAGKLTVVAEKLSRLRSA